MSSRSTASGPTPEGARGFIPETGPIRGVREEGKEHVLA
jgi:hypothetical protein